MSLAFALGRRGHLRRALREIEAALAAALDGDPKRALDQAGRAVRAFIRQRRSAWAALARLQLLKVRITAGSRPVRPSEAAAVADALDAAGWSASGVQARLLAGRLALERGQLAVARAHLRMVSRRRRRGPAAMRAQAWHGEALLRLAEGTVAVSSRRSPPGCASSTSTRLRSARRTCAPRRRTELTRLALRVALADGRAGQVLCWAERGRAQRLLHRLNPPAVRLARSRNARTVRSPRS